MGEGLRQEWMRGLVRVCNTTVMFICTIGSGPCEVDIAALNIKTSIAATNANVKVCTWSHDPRNNFAEVGTARVHTALGEAYMAHKLHLAGYTPVPDPGERAERSRKLVKALLDKPLKTLHMNTDGYLLIPTPDEVCQLLQMREMTNETGCVKRLARKVLSRVSLPRGAAAADAAGRADFRAECSTDASTEDRSASRNARNAAFGAGAGREQSQQGGT